MAGATASGALETAISNRFLGPSDSIELKSGQPQPLGLFYDLDVFERGLKDVQNAFGAGITKLLIIAKYILQNIYSGPVYMIPLNRTRHS